MKTIILNMKKFLVKTTILRMGLIALVLFVQCATVNDEYPECVDRVDRIVLTTLDNEPARIQKDLYGNFCKDDSFIVLLLNQRDAPPTTSERFIRSVAFLKHFGWTIYMF